MADHELSMALEDIAHVLEEETMTKHPKFEVHLGHGSGKDDWYFDLKDPSGEVGFRSGGYGSSEEANKALAFLKRWAANAWVIQKDTEAARGS
jgi:uncharacterized protein YegP (UPF0339 family)